MRQRDERERQQIGICRVLCIFFMMSVHVNPGLSSDTLVSTGALAWLGQLWGNVLGRASVAALSFVSGYLLVRTAADLPLRALAGKKLRTLIVPMLTWNLVFCALLVAKLALLEGSGEASRFEADAGAVAALTGLSGPTANQSLFFLRDLFIAALIVHLLAPWLRRWPVPLLAAIALIAIFDAAAPVVFRPSILFFVAAGAVAAQRVAGLADLVPARRALAVAAVLGAALVAVRIAGPDAEGPLREAEDLLRRGLLVVLVLAVGARLAGTRVGGGIALLERNIFETYLLHVPLISVLWVPWVAAVGGPEHGSYLVFFLAAPVVAVAAGRVLGGVADRLPPLAQKLVRGKVAPAELACRQPAWS